MRKLAALAAALSLTVSTPALAADWQFAETEHFKIYAEDTPERTVEFARELERLDDALRMISGIGPSKGDTSEFIKVTVFRFGETADMASLAGAAGSQAEGQSQPALTPTDGEVRPSKLGGAVDVFASRRLYVVGPVDGRRAGVAAGCGLPADWESKRCRRLWGDGAGLWVDPHRRGCNAPPALPATFGLTLLMPVRQNGMAGGGVRKPDGGKNSGPDSRRFSGGRVPPLGMVSVGRP